MAIEWNDEKMATGFPEIDAQHKEWIRRINEFDDAVVNHKGQEMIQNTLEFLTQYSETHFAGEEAIMAKHKSPVQEPNRAAHDEFRRKLAEIRAWVKNEGSTSVEVIELEDALEKWLVNHICTVDVELRNVDPDQ
jgi:hemerythrin-like metal-binding protein